MRPFFEHYTLGEVTTGRVEWFLKSEHAISYSRAKHSRTVLNQIFDFALRHERDATQPGRGHLAAAQTQGPRSGADAGPGTGDPGRGPAWRTGPALNGPRPDGQVRDALEVLLGTSMRPPYTILRPGWFDAGTGTDEHVDARQGDLVEYGPGHAP